MTTPRPDDEAALWRQWRQAVQREPIDRAITDLYARIDQAIADRNPTCWISGRCCNFDEFGHRLYVTGLEVQWVLEKARRHDEREARRHAGTKAHSDDEAQRHEKIEEQNGESKSGDKLLSVLSDPSCLRACVPACLFQSNNLCTIHTIRPLGCRIFFCQEGTQDWQQELYEQFQNQLRALHDAHDLPYRYLEWRAGLHEALTQPAHDC